MSSFCSRRVLTQDDFNRFAALSGDDNPIHCDPEFAKTTHFGATVAHGMFLYSLINKALGELYPGPGVLQVQQELMFPNPTFVGDEISICLQLQESASDLIQLQTTVSKLVNGVELITATGHSLVRAKGCFSDLNDVSADHETVINGDTSLYGLQLGQMATSERSFSLDELEQYGDLTGDRNPLFRDDAYASAQGFSGRLIPGPMLAGMFSDLLGTRLPGRGTGWLKQKLTFVGAAYPGETLSATVKIVRLRADKELVYLQSDIQTLAGRKVCVGESLVLVRNLENKG